MADPTQYTFDLKELTELLVKHQGLTSGKWMLGAEFNFGAMMAGNSQNEVKPSAVVQLNRIQLTQAPPDAPAQATVVDASQLANPKKGLRAKR
jgi:hypothetical protein